MHTSPLALRSKTSRQAPQSRLSRAFGRRFVVSLFAAAALPLVLGTAHAAGSDAAKLGKDLTPVGAERAGNKEGTIPAWSPERQDLPGFVAGKTLRQSVWKHKDDQALYSINASNVDKYADKLSPGQVALIKNTPDFKMEVFPTRRTCDVPKFVVDNTAKNVSAAKIGEDGWSLKEAFVPGVPFPMPTQGIEAIWNMKMRYRGAGAVGVGTTYLSPRRGSSEWILPKAEQTNFIPWGAPGSRKLSEIGSANFSTYFTFLYPVALAGQSVIVTDYLDQSGSDAYYYFPGQRRVRRMPAYAYDAQQIGFENQYAVDDTAVFTGAPDRFDWKIVGKREMIVPYNAFGALDFQSEWSTIVKPNGLVANHRHYELHRVWVLEATIKAGMRHTSPKRVYYLDEDSWNAVFAEDYDTQGKLWKVREGYLVPIYETGSCDVEAFAQYNFTEGRFLFDFSPIGTGRDAIWYVQPTGPAMKSSFYTSDNLRALSTR